MANPLTPEEIKAYCDELQAKDLQYAADLDACQAKFLQSKPRIKNWKEFESVEDIKRVMLGLHEKVELSGTLDIKGIEVTIVHPKP